MNIQQPRWKVPEYGKREINSAGNTMRDPNATPAEKDAAIQIIDNWRASHAYPLQIFYYNLHRMQGKREDIIVAQRLKRLHSIVGKLYEQPCMELWRMHDIGGCRMVLPNVSEVYRMSEKLRNSRIRHEFKRTYDYIEKPKTSGYRSLHLVYKFHSDTPGKELYNQNMLIELQFRTHLQHIWATALETIGIFTHQALKAGHGSEDLLRFFVLVSSLFAMKEGYPIVPGTLPDTDEIISEIEYINEKAHALDILKGIRTAISHETDRCLDKRGYYILSLNYEDQTTKVTYYSPSDTERANSDYNEVERYSEGRPLDSVLVRAASFSSVRAAYPNYFLDIAEFIALVEEYLKL